MPEPRPTTIRPYEPGDEHGILQSFNVVFREVCGPSYVDRGLAYWRWQFQANPEGHRISVAVTDDGTVAAHYGGVPYRMATPYGDCHFIHIVDSFVHPDFRVGLKSPGLFVRTAIPWFADCYKRGDAVPYGFPVRTAERIGQRYLYYNHLRSVDYLCHDLATDFAGSSVTVRRATEIGTEIDRLFAVFAGPRCMTRRSSAYIHWRYLTTPAPNPYEVYTAWRGASLAGLMVLRPIHELLPHACTIVDWVVPDADHETTDALLAHAAERARSAQRRLLLTVFAEPSPEYRAFQARGFRIEASRNTLERRLTYQIYFHDIAEDWLRQNWWYTLGDSDLA